jgi:hypothetical protein
MKVVEKRNTRKCNLLFLAGSWKFKCGDIAPKDEIVASN